MALSIVVSGARHPSAARALGAAFLRPQVARFRRRAAFHYQVHNRGSCATALDVRASNFGGFFLVSNILDRMSTLLCHAIRFASATIRLLICLTNTGSKSTVRVNWTQLPSRATCEANVPVVIDFANLAIRLETHDGKHTE
jgi:hypothetical protein